MSDFCQWKNVAVGSIKQDICNSQIGLTKRLKKIMIVIACT